MTDINLEIKDRNRLKEFFHRLHSRLEDLLFSIIQKLPEKLIPTALMEWLDKYLDKRLSELKAESIKTAWTNMYLQDALNNIKNPDK